MSTSSDAVWRDLRQSFAQEFRADPEGSVQRLGHAVLSSCVSAEEAAEVLLPYLVRASYAQQNLVYNTLREVAAPQDILRAALSGYRDSDDPRLLAVAAALLEDHDAASWPALARLARSRRPECRYFVTTMAGLRGVSAEDRKQVLAELARNPDPDTQWKVLEAGETIAPEDAAEVWRILAESSDKDVRTAACDRLASLND